MIQSMRISCREDGAAIMHFCHLYYNHVEYRTPWGGHPRSNMPLLKLPSLVCALAAFVCSSVVGQAAEVKGPLILETTILLPDVSGRLEHLAVDASGKRLFVAETDSNAVDVIDLSSHQRLQHIAGLAQPRGLAYLPEADLLVIANGADGTVRFYSGADFSLRGNVPLGDDSNEVLIDPRNGNALVGYDTSRIAVIDASTPKWLSDIPLPSRAEGFAVSRATGRLFVNVPMAGKMVMVDLSSQTGGADSPPALLH